MASVDLQCDIVFTSSRHGKISGITTISEQGTYDELKENGGTFQKWHAYKTKCVKSRLHRALMPCALAAWLWNDASMTSAGIGQH